MRLFVFMWSWCQRAITFWYSCSTLQGEGADPSALDLPSKPSSDPVNPPAIAARQQPTNPSDPSLAAGREWCSCWSVPEIPGGIPPPKLSFFRFASYRSSRCNRVCSCATTRDSFPHHEPLSFLHPHSFPIPTPNLSPPTPPSHLSVRATKVTCWPSRWPLCWAGGSGSRQKAPWPRSPWG